MNLRNENSKIYFLIKIFSICVVISAILYFIADDGSVMQQKSLRMALLVTSLNFIFAGTKKVIAKNNKKGYFDYLCGAFYLLMYATI